MPLPLSPGTPAYFLQISPHSKKEHVFVARLISLLPLSPEWPRNLLLFLEVLFYCQGQMKRAATKTLHPPGHQPECFPFSFSHSPFFREFVAPFPSSPPNPAFLTPTGLA